MQIKWYGALLTAMCMLTACGGTSQSISSDTDGAAQAETTAESAEPETTTENAAESESVLSEEQATENSAETAMELQEYGIEEAGYTVDVPMEFENLLGDYPSANTAIFGHPEEVGDEDAIVIGFLDSASVSPEEFAAYSAEDLFSKVDMCLSSEEVQYFEPVTVMTESGETRSGYKGEMQGMISEENPCWQTVVILYDTANDDLFLLAVRDEYGELEEYRNNLEQMIHID